MKRISIGALVFIACSWIAESAIACSTFCYKDNQRVLFGWNYDWNIGRGLVMVNKRNVAKKSIVSAPHIPAQWTSRYGSLTFNQYGREFPSGGINEAGLVIELMMHTAGKYPPIDARPAVGVLEWIQYQLDNHATVQELITHGETVRIASSVPLHFLIADKGGRIAAIEFLNGKFVAHAGAALPAPVLTNDTYQRSVSYLRSFSGFGGSAAIPSGYSSLERFARAASRIKDFANSPSFSTPVKAGFDILSNVAQPGFTKWNIIYDVKNLTVYFRTSDASSVRRASLKDFDLSCKTPVKMLSMNRNLSGNALPSFVSYTAAVNLELVRFSYANTSFLASTPDSEVRRFASHGASGKCTE